MIQDANKTNLGRGGVVPLDSDDIDFYNFRFKGRKSEVDKLIRHLDEKKDCYELFEDVTSGEIVPAYTKGKINSIPYKMIRQDKEIAEVLVASGDNTPKLLRMFPALKATGFCENWDKAKVGVVYSESGSSVITEVRWVGKFDPDDDASNGRWAIYRDVLSSFAYAFRFVASGSPENGFYSYPPKLKKMWDDDSFLIIDGEKSGNVPNLSNKAGDGPFSLARLAKNNAMAGKAPFDGIKFAASGDLEHFPESGPYPTRKALKALIESMGGQLTGSVSGKTTCLICNDANTISNKVSAALQNDVPIISESAFMNVVKVTKGTKMPAKEPQKKIPSSALTPVPQMKTVDLSKYVIKNGVLSAYRGKDTTLTIPDTVEKVKESTLPLSTQIITIYLSATVKDVDLMLYRKCKKLERIDADLENQFFTTVDGVLFNKDKTILIRYPSGRKEASYTIPETVKRIEAGAFMNSALEEIVIPKNVREIGDEAFLSCKKLKSATVSANIGESAFAECVKLGTMTLLEGVESIGESAFWFCNKLKAIIFPSSLRSIGKKAFDTHVSSGLSKIVLPEGIESIGADAFHFAKISEIKIPASVKQIGLHAFGIYLAKYTVAKNNSSYTDIDGVLFTKDKKSLLEFPARKTGDTYVIPDGVECIGADAFQFAEISEIKIPASVKQIGLHAFGISLAKYTVAKNNSTYTDIDGVLFTKDKKSLLEFPARKTGDTYVIPDGVECIEEVALKECRVKRLILPDSLTTVKPQKWWHRPEEVIASDRVRDLLMAVK